MRPRRPHNPRPRKRTLLIQCEGQKTEPNYLDDLCKACGVRHRLGVTVKAGKGQNAVITVNAAIAEGRRRLLDAPCATPAETSAYRAALVALVAERTGESAKPLPEAPDLAWKRPRTAPAVADFARSKGLAPPSDVEWAALTDLERFVLVKLSRDNHDNVNFVPAMWEFGLVG